ncbi:MAG: hypothetical protein P8X96_07035 [Desulfobacteraceae bacterium]
MKKNNKLPSIIVIIVAVLLLIYYFSNDEEVFFSDPKWNCSNSTNKWKCSVSFEVTNNTHQQQFRKVSIRGVTISGGKYGRIEMRGEKIFDIEMAPKEIIEVNEYLLVDRKPIEIKVKIWE